MKQGEVIEDPIEHVQAKSRVDPRLGKTLPERGGQQEPAIRMPPAHEHLQRRSAFDSQRHDGLVVKFEGALPHSACDLRERP